MTSHALKYRRGHPLALLSVVLVGSLACGDETTELNAPLVSSGPADPAVCPGGGTTVRSGLDANGDGILANDEVSSTLTTCDGAPGDDGMPGDDGARTLVETSEEAPGAQCPAGGQRVDVGRDVDADGMLSAAEIDSTTYVCRGVDGADANALLTETSTAVGAGCPSTGTVLRSGVDANGNGTLETAEIRDEQYICDGADGAPVLVVITDEPSGARCPAGGRNLRLGRDLDRDGRLAVAEIEDESYLCNPVENLLVATPLAAGTSTACPSGGTRFDSGLDTDGDGVLSATEIDASVFVCAGADGAGTLISQTAEPAGSNCTLGGFRVAVGTDADTDGVLSAAEETEVSYVCDAADGSDAIGTATRISVEPAGSNCAEGGTRVETGPDANADGALSTAEVTQTRFVCDQSGTEALVVVASEPAGPNCAQGGQRIQSGADLDADGVLDAGEVQSTVYACSSVAAYPIDVSTTSLPDTLIRNPYSVSIDAVGGLGGGFRWAVVGSLPAGLTLDTSGTPSTVLSGRPSQEGTFSFGVQVTDYFGNTATRTLTLVVGEAVSVSSWVLPRMLRGAAYSTTLTALGGSTPYTWALSGGFLPPGLSLSSGGVISGTPTGPGGKFVVSVTDATGTVVKAGLEIAPEQRFSAYCGDYITDARYDISLIPTTFTSTGTVLTPTDATGAAGSVVCSDTTFSPGGRWLGFTADIGNGDEAWVVDLRATQPSAVKVSGTLVANGDVYDLLFSPDDRWLAYRADQDVDIEYELFIVDLEAASPTPVQVNQAFTGAQDVETGFAFTADGTRLVYRADERVDNTTELFVFTPGSAGGSSQVVNAPPLSGSVDSDSWSISPDGRWVLYAAQQDATDYEAYLVDISGPAPGTPIKVNGNLSGGDVGASTSGPIAGELGFSPNGVWVHYIADVALEADALYVRNIETLEPATLASHAVTGTTLNVFTPIWSPDGRRIGFEGDLLTDGYTELFYADTLLLGSPIKLGPTYDSTIDFSDLSGDDDFEWGPDGSYIIYRADEDVDGSFEPYLVRIRTPGTSVRIFPSGIADDAYDVEVSETGRAFVTAEVDGTADTGIYAFDVTASTVSTPVRLNAALGTNQDVTSTSMVATAAGGVMYLSDEAVDAETEAWYSDGATASTPRRLNPTLPSSGDLSVIVLQAE